MRRGAVLQGFQEESEAVLGFFLGKSQRLEDLRLDVLAMNTDCAGAEKAIASELGRNCGVDVVDRGGG